MSSDYYFQQCKEAIRKLEDILSLDLHYQDTKAHDKSDCDASIRLSGILGSYIACYNTILNCLQQNLQVQKTEDIQLIVNAIVARILELKEQLRKHQGCYYQFICRGLITHKLSTYDAELSNICYKKTQSDNIKIILQEAFERARILKENEENTENGSDSLIIEENYEWWNEHDDSKDNGDLKHVGINIGAIYAVEEIISEETLNRWKIIHLIQAHERSRQFTLKSTLEKQKRIMWERELKGILNPATRLEIRVRAAKIIQKVLRLYFEIKRANIKTCKFEELIDTKQFRKSNYDTIKEDDHKLKLKRYEMYNEYFENWKNECRKLESEFLLRRSKDLAEDYRDYIRDWFRKWFDEAKFFLEIPKENQGGLNMILKEQLPSPSEWLKQYEAYVEAKKANKNKTATELKWEKKEAERENMMLRREEMRKKKKEADLLRKIMKNPKMHPGYHYPKSKKVQQIINAIQDYKKKWLDIDELDDKNVKEGFLKEIDEENIYAKAKEQILAAVEDDMREELKLLKVALTEDYINNEEAMPENIKQKMKRVKKPRKIKNIDENVISEKLTDLATKGILVEYPETRFADFIGEYNFAGDDLKCDLKTAQPLRGEMLANWWERCRDVTHGYKKILLVGPKASGKTILTRAMASLNKATLYDLNLLQFYQDHDESLKKLISNLLSSAKATQPSVIYIRHIHRLYYRKTQPNEVNLNSTLLKKLVKRLLKKIHNNDKICIVGSCVEPWLSKSKQMVKHFPNVLMIPPTSYTTTQLILQKWILNNRIVPHTLDTQSLAYMLQGYSFGYIKNTLDEFLSPVRIVRIAAFGLDSREIFEHFLLSETETKVEYEKYNKWYYEKTHWGAIERKHLEEQIEFKNVLEKWKEKEEKKRKTS